MPIQCQLRRDTAANWNANNPTLLSGEQGLETDTKRVKVGDGTTAWRTLGYFPPPPAIPSKREEVFSYSGVLAYMTDITIGTQLIPEIDPYTHGATVVATAYQGGCYSPDQNRLYLIPYVQATATVWHYLDGAASSTLVTPYTHGVTVVSGGYCGAAYSPTPKRIYLCPWNQSTATQWHYIDCAAATVLVTAFSTSATVVANGYCGMVHSPTQDRLYLIPYNQATAVVWHYISSGGTVTPYTHSATVVAAGYAGGVWSPVQNRIYFVPNTQATSLVWHYIDCSVTSSTITPYTHGATVVATGYYGGCYSITQNRIYFIPASQSTATVWHYVDCNSGSIVAYTHGATVVANAYQGGVYCPTQNRIYLVPAAQSTAVVWHYIDCANGSVVAYTHGATVVATAYWGGCYSPLQNRVNFIPYTQSTATVWHYNDADPGIGSYPSKWIMAGALYNKL